MRTILVAAISLAIVPGAAFAQEAPRAERVQVSDLNLAGPSAERTVRARVRAAAQRVCQTEARGLRFVQAERACVRAAEKRAMAEFEPMMLTARRGGPVMASAVEAK